MWHQIILNFGLNTDKNNILSPYSYTTIVKFRVYSLKFKYLTSEAEGRAFGRQQNADRNLET